MTLSRARFPLVLLAGVVLSFAFPAVDAAPLAWIGLIPLLITATRQSMRTGLVLGLLFGIGFFGSLLIWISLVGWVAWVILVATQSLFIGIFGALYALISSRLRSGWQIIAAPALWTAIEYARSLFPVGGFTWGQLAQSQHDLGWMLRTVGIGGAWLLTFLLVLVNALIALAINRLAKGEPRPALATLVGAVVLTASPLVLPGNDATGSSARVAIVQGNVPRDWDGSFYEKDLAILQSHKDLTENLDTSGIDFIVWPESSVGIDPEVDPAARDILSEAARSAGVPLVVGGNSEAGEDHYKVMAFQVAPDGTIVDRYQKTHLVPFGEYVPARALLDWIPMLDQIPRDAVAADEPTLFELAGGKVAPVLSYEGDFGSLVRGRIAAGGRMLLVVTNTSTWGESWASEQHVAFSQLRAAENGVWVVHAAISGISAFVAPDGSISGSTDLWNAATLQRVIRFAEDTTLYTRMGDWVPLACAAGTLLLIIAAALKPLAKAPAPDA